MPKMTYINPKNAKKLEIFGLVFVLFTTFFQVFLIDIFTENAEQTHGFIVRETFYDLLSNQEKIAQLSYTEDKYERLKIADEIVQRSGERKIQILDDRDDIFNIWLKGEERLKIINTIIFTIGTILLVLGKYVEFLLVSPKQ